MNVFYSLMSLPGTLWSILTGPKVYANYRSPNKNFPRNAIESFGETILLMMSGCKSVCAVLSPVLFMVRSFLYGLSFDLMQRFKLDWLLIEIYNFFFFL